MTWVSCGTNQNQKSDIKYFVLDENADFFDFYPIKLKCGQLRKKCFSFKPGDWINTFYLQPIS